MKYDDDDDAESLVKGQKKCAKGWSRAQTADSRQTGRRRTGAGKKGKENVKHMRRAR